MKLSFDDIKNLLERIKLRPRERFFLGMFVLCALLLAYYRPVYLPKATHLKVLKNRYVTLHSQRVKLESELPDVEVCRKKVEDMKSGFDQLQQKLALLESEMPDETQTSELLAFLTSNTGRLNFKLNSVKPEKMEMITTKGLVTEAETEQKKPGAQEDKGIPMYKLLPIEIGFSAPFEDIIIYVGNLEKGSSYLKIKEYKMKIDQAGSGIPEVSLTVQALLTAPRQRATEERKEVFATLNNMLNSISADPFNPKAKPLEIGEAGDLELQGIIWKRNRPTAIINGEICTIGEIFRGKKVSEITQDSVIMEEKGRKFTLTLGGK